MYNVTVLKLLFSRSMKIVQKPTKDMREILHIFRSFLTTFVELFVNVR